MNILPTMVSASDLQRDSSRILNLVITSDQPIIVIRNNKPEVAMINVDKLQKMTDQIKLLEEQELVRGIRQTEKEFKEGKLKSTTDLSEFLDD